MLRRRRPPPILQDSCFDTLVDDVLILVLCQCSIPDLLALRLTNQRMRNLITRYIATIAPSCARSTFPNAELLLTRPDVYTFEWLKSLIPRQLAAILVDRHRVACGGEQLRYGIPAEDAQGTELRARVANGWRVLRRLANVSIEVYDAPSDDSSMMPLDKLKHRFRSKLEVQRQKEDLILSKRLEYIKSMSVELAQDYKLMNILLSSAFRTAPHNTALSHKPWVFDWGGGIDGPRLFRKGDTWLAWFVLSEGTDLFWNQWHNPNLPNDVKEHYIRDRSLTVWEHTKTDMADHQRDHARIVMEAVDEKACVETQFVNVNPIPYFTKYGEYRMTKGEQEEEVKETMGDVSFFVEFRYPEELAKRRIEERSAMVGPAR